MLTKTKMMFGVLTAAALMAHAAPSRADGKTYPGSMCVGSDYSVYLTLDDVQAAVSVSAETSLYCPMVGDSELGASKGLNPVRVYLNESTVTPTPAGEQANTSCTVARYGSMHGVPFDSMNATASGGGQVTLSLSLTTANGPQWARYGLFCRLTRNSTLFGYDADEIE
jgi:hypothetical protein